MSRRGGNRRSRDVGRRADDMFSVFGATYAWRAESAVDNGANTTSLPSYIGSLDLLRDGSGQVPKFVSANFGGRVSLPFGGTNAGYSAALTIAASMTFVSVYRVTAQNSGVHAVTVGGTANTGNSSGYTTATFSQKVVSAATKALALPSKAVAVSVFTAAGVSHYMNGMTPVTVAPGGALVGDRLTIGALDTSGTFTLAGEWRTTAYFARALTNAEAGVLLTSLGLREGIAISP